MVLQKQLFKLKLKMFARKTTAHVYASLKIDSRSSGTRTYYWWRRKQQYVIWRRHLK